MLGRDSEDEIWSRFVFELVIWTQPSGPLCLWQCFVSIPQALTLCLQNFAKDQGKGADKKYDFRFSPQVPCSELFLRAEQGWEGHCSYHRYFITKVWATSAHKSALFDTLVSGMGRVASWAGWGGQLVFLRGRCPAGGEEARGGLASITASPPLNLLASYQRNSNNAERYTRPNLIHLKENRFFLNKVLLISLCYPLTKIKLGHWSDISKYHCFFDVKEKHSESFFSNWKTCVFT